MHFYHSRIFFLFVVEIIFLNFAFCGESERPTKEREPPYAIHQRESPTPISGHDPPSSLGYVRRREVQPPPSGRTGGSVVDDVIDDDRATNGEIGSDLKNKTVKKQLKKQEDGTDVQNHGVKNSSVSEGNASDKNSTLPNEPNRSSDPGAKTRGVIVFGSLGLFSFAYLAYKIYSKRKRDSDSGHNPYRGDLQQFKYGVLTSSEAEDNLELARLPSMMESDEEEMEIFDLESRRRPDGKGGRAVDEDPLTRDDKILGPGAGRSTPTGDDDLLDLREGSCPALAPAASKTTEGVFSSRRAGNENFFDVL